MIKIGYVEDNIDFANLVKDYLGQEGYGIEHFDTGEKAMPHVNDDYAMWILDIMLPGNVSGYDLIKKIRENHPTMPVIFVSNRDEDLDRVMGLELGSDDYIGKSSIRELVLRVKKLLLRAYPQDNSNNNAIEYNEYTIDLDKRIVKDGNEAINLTAKEYDLLTFLLKNKTHAFSRDQILNAVWGSEYFGSDRVVDDLMRRLRSKMPRLNVETIYGYGYRLL
ncbi:MAG: response regulator transcription factor [Acholeplasmatales bacterium]|nr:response regulator transcription factor [Acholeplasmatales bacterium]